MKQCDAWEERHSLSSAVSVRDREGLSPLQRRIILLAIERRNQILERLQREKRVVVASLSEEFRVSEETIRRDLEKLEKDGYATKTYGGAVIRENSTLDLPYTVRKNTNVEGKQQIAMLIAGLIEDGDSLMLDASSTAVFVAREIRRKRNITVITNSLEVLIELAETRGWKVLSTGGTMKEGSLAFTGHQSEKMLSGYHVDKSVFSCKGLDIDRGMTDASDSFAELKRTMMHCSGLRILAADCSKFDVISFAEIGSMEDVDIIVTDREPDERWKQFFQAQNIRMIYPGSADAPEPEPASV